MTTATLTFTLPEENEEFRACCRATDYMSAIEDIKQEIFRPARKHGYSNQREISELLIKLGGDGENLIGLLENRFVQILEDNGILYD